MYFYDKILAVLQSHITSPCWKSVWNQELNDVVSKIQKKNDASPWDAKTVISPM